MWRLSEGFILEKLCGNRFREKQLRRSLWEKRGRLERIHQLCKILPVMLYPVYCVHLWCLCCSSNNNNNNNNNSDKSFWTHFSWARILRFSNDGYTAHLYIGFVIANQCLFFKSYLSVNSNSVIYHLLY